MKQGGVISPLLFAFYLDILIERLIDTNVGCFIGRMCISVLDIQMITKSYDETTLCLRIIW